MRLLFARLLLRLRGHINCNVFVDGVSVTEGDVILVRRHRRYVTIWSLWYERTFDDEGEKHWHPELTVECIPWRKVDGVMVRYGSE